MTVGEMLGVYIVQNNGTHRRSESLSSNIYALLTDDFIFKRLNVMLSGPPKFLISSFMHIILFSSGFAHYNIISMDRSLVGIHI